NNQARTDKVYPDITYDQARRYKGLMQANSQVSISTNVSGATVVKSAADKTNPNINVIAGDEFYLPNQNLSLERGRSFSTYELDLGSNVAIIGKEISDKLFPKIDPVGQYITFLGRRFK